jgi:hypothetical protein
MPKNSVLKCCLSHLIPRKSPSLPLYSIPNLDTFSHAVAEFTVGLILTTVRKYHKAYNRVREGDFTLSGT